MRNFPFYIQYDVMDCGPTCLRMVATFYGKLIGMAEVMMDERSVSGRLLSPLRYLWEKYL